jgi:hypothetical protein
MWRGPCEGREQSQHGMPGNWVGRVGGERAAMEENRPGMSGRRLLCNFSLGAGRGGAGGPCGV